jgi:methionyl-tRNA formyltransferase
MTPAPLRIHIITEEDPFYLPVFFREFFSLLRGDRFVVTGVDITPPLNQKSRGKLARKLYRFYGPIDFARLACRYVARRVLDAGVPTGAWRGTVPRIASAYGVPSSPVADVNAAEYVEKLRALHVDLLLSVAASQIFRNDLLGVPRLASLNVHTGTLPQYRGMLPVFWQLSDGCESIGITIHTMSIELDLGEIVVTRQVPLRQTHNLDTAIRTMKAEGARAMLDAIELYWQGTVAPTPMDPSGARYRSFPGRDDARAFRKMGGHLL